MNIIKKKIRLAGAQLARKKAAKQRDWKAFVAACKIIEELTQD